MTTKLINTPQDLKERRQFGFRDDFDWLLSPHRWTSVLSDSGSAAVGSGTGGIAVLLPSDGTVADNDETYLRSTNPVFKFANLKPLVAERVARMPEASIVWHRAQVKARADAARAASKPVWAAQGFAVIALIVALVWIGPSSSWYAWAWQTVSNAVPSVSLSLPPIYAVRFA